MGSNSARTARRILDVSHSSIRDIPHRLVPSLFLQTERHCRSYNRKKTAIKESFAQRTIGRMKATLNGCSKISRQMRRTSHFNWMSTPWTLVYRRHIILVNTRWCHRLQPIWQPGAASHFLSLSGRSSLKDRDAYWARKRALHSNLWAVCHSFAWQNRARIKSKTYAICNQLYAGWQTPHTMPIQ